jgi:hypothetical protein
MGESHFMFGIFIFLAFLAVQMPFLGLSKRAATRSIKRLHWSTA